MIKIGGGAGRNIDTVNAVNVCWNVSCAISTDASPKAESDIWDTGYQCWSTGPSSFKSYDFVIVIMIWKWLIPGFFFCSLLVLLDNIMLKTDAAVSAKQRSQTEMMLNWISKSLNKTRRECGWTTHAYKCKLDSELNQRCVHALRFAVWALTQESAA